MRRMLGLTLALLLIAVPFLASAQSVYPIVGPGGTLLYSDASVTAVNSASEISAFQYTIPPAYLATATSVGATATQYFDGRTATGLNTPVLWNTPVPMHLSMLGTIAAAAPAANFNIGVNLGGTAATLTLANTITGGISGFGVNQGLPMTLDVWLVPIASSTATPNAVNNYFMAARLALGATWSATNTIAAVTLASPNQLNVLMRWGAASSASSATFFKRLLKLGD